MKKIFAVFILAVTLFNLYGCGIIYESRKKELLLNAKLEDYGQLPPDDHKEIERQIILSSLKDPDSAKFNKWMGPDRFVIPSSNISPTPKPVWRTSVDVNAKNSYGGYTGFQSYVFAWSNGKIYALTTPRYHTWWYLTH